MKIRKGAKLLRNVCLAAVIGMSASGYAAPQAQTPLDATPDSQKKVDVPDDTSAQKNDSQQEPIGDSNTLGMGLVRNIFSDQKAIWTSPAHLRWSSASWFFPLAAVTAGFFATDRAVPPALSSDPTKLNRYVHISDYGAYSMIGATGGLYLFSKISHNDHQRETGILAGEAAIDSLAVSYALKTAFGRARPYQEQGLGDFFQHDNSFPSEHSALAWSIASVFAHEYPGPLTQVAAYGLATVISATRVMGKQHFPSDVVIGGAIGWLVGWQVYRSHHDPELGGGGWADLNTIEEGEEHRARQKMGSPFVPLDSWVYSVLERLSALGYIHSSIMGIKPWTRIECARLTEEATEQIQNDPLSGAARAMQARLEQEFAYEISLLGGGRNMTANLESVYARAVSISGPPLTDGYHFGQTLSDDFGRPFERGTNGQIGGSFSAAAGPLDIYVRAEYQHAPSAPALPASVLSVLASRDLVPVSTEPSGALAVNAPQLLDAYASVNLDNWQLVIGKESFSWTPGPDGSMIWSDDIAPINLVRLVNPEPVHLPGFLNFLGPIKVDQFFGRMENHFYIPRPFVLGEKLNVKPFSFLELGFSRTLMLGGQGSDSPLTGSNLLHGFLGLIPSGLGSVPGHSTTGMDWTFYVPKVKNYIVLYGDSMAEDDILPIENPARNPWHPGLYITRIPGIPKLDFHIEGVSTEQSGLVLGLGNHGQFNYWNQTYRDGYADNGYLIGNTVGRDGRAIQGWFTYWLSSQDTIRFRYQHSTVSSDYLPGGGAWQDYSVSNEMHFGSGLYVKSQMQYEHISYFPILFNGPQKNITAILEVGFSFRDKVKK